MLKYLFQFQILISKFVKYLSKARSGIAAAPTAACNRGREQQPQQATRHIIATLTVTDTAPGRSKP